ncbi:hypothetical protein B0H14DRAFT_2782300 [Mycena olivaceomarginata]|nr:hypothetical protein B0H14DRAFT_2782300 [Mycena olivaceomarginata]
MCSCPRSYSRPNTLDALFLVGSHCRFAFPSRSSITCAADDLVSEHPSRTRSAQMRLCVSSRVRLGARAAPPHREYCRGVDANRAGLKSRHAARLAVQLASNTGAIACAMSTPSTSSRYCTTPRPRLYTPPPSSPHSCNLAIAHTDAVAEVARVSNGEYSYALLPFCHIAHPAPDLLSSPQYCPIPRLGARSTDV